MPNYKNKILFLTVDKNTSPSTHSYLAQVGRKHSFDKGKGNLNKFLGGTFMKNVVTGHRYLYQMKNAIKCASIFLFTYILVWLKIQIKVLSYSTVES